MNAAQATHTVTHIDGTTTVKTIIFAAIGGATGESEGDTGNEEAKTFGGEAGMNAGVRNGGTGDDKGTSNAGDRAD